MINFVAEGTIEEGMLSVSKFKNSLFSGVLDGGEREVFLGGSRLTRFMETVQKTTAARTVPAVVQKEEPNVTVRTGDEQPAPRAAVAGPSTGGTPGTLDPWAGLLQTGLTLLERLAAASRTPSDQPPRDSASCTATRPRRSGCRRGRRGDVHRHTGTFALSSSNQFFSYGPRWVPE